MEYIFNEQERQDAYRTKRRLWLFWIAVLVVFLAVEAALITVNLVDVSTTRSRRFYVPFAILGITAAVLFAGFSLFFFSVKFRLTRKYVKMLRDIDRGLKDTTVGRFTAFDEDIGEKDGVFFYSMILECNPLKRGDITTRKVLIEKTKPKPDVSPGDRLRFTTHANILVSYEFLSRISNAPKE
ncbi:MAG: hypothetical protein LBH24_06010 [Clostridiales bacterium]|jgi:hypothetical protein|nr:hypothetical protein [Clostridiales bacterium]